ncbi:hypothetical protein B0T19DRAFT_443543 [Cercophora scortea]|uniref:Uncharacterized protein n=1 Tax=Cercophora scortea TaxID=314031 RepID=A0AAE0IFN0_9PEZI|nr:hypothetical protein B0T19DRAFT_443543 [Cercophora scortea]
MSFDDSTLKSRWDTLDYSIRQLVVDHFSHPLNLTVTSGPGEITFGHLTPFPASLLEREKSRAYLIRAFIWRELMFDVFSHAFYQEKEPRISIKEYKEWEVCTATLLQRGTPSSTAPNMNRRTDELESQLRIYSTYTARNNRLAADLRAIFTEATKLDAKLVACRALYRVFMYHELEDTKFHPQKDIDEYLRRVPCHGFSFDPDQMEPIIMDKQPERGAQVDLVVSPSLVKYGDHEGENYETGMFISRREVICDLRYYPEPTYGGPKRGSYARDKDWGLGWVRDDQGSTSKCLPGW